MRTALSWLTWTPVDSLGDDTAREFQRGDGVFVDAGSARCAPAP